jgi:hypothetical protein
MLSVGFFPDAQVFHRRYHLVLDDAGWHCVGESRLFGAAFCSLSILVVPGSPVSTLQEHRTNPGDADAAPTEAASADSGSCGKPAGCHLHRDGEKA